MVWGESICPRSPGVRWAPLVFVVKADHLELFFTETTSNGEGWKITLQEESGGIFGRGTQGRGPKLSCGPLWWPSLHLAKDNEKKYTTGSVACSPSLVVFVLFPATEYTRGSAQEPAPGSAHRDLGPAPPPGRLLSLAVL